MRFYLSKGMGILLGLLVGILFIRSDPRIAIGLALLGWLIGSLIGLWLEARHD